jgi:2-deoxy-D-gluconate 3-dehydrogenase
VNILDSFNLEGKTALVTGASRGLGQAMAVGLAEAGADIAGIYQHTIQDTAQQVQALGRRFFPIQLNLLKASPQDLQTTIQNLARESGSVDILVNNAGIIRRAPLLEYKAEDWDDVMQVNLRAVFFLSQAAARLMAERGSGKIINIASMLSFQGGIRVPAYTASKSGILGLTRLFANELAGKGINVNAIAPGYMTTDFTAPLQADPQRGPAILERIPAGRWGTPEDLKGLTVFLASEAANYLHGAIIPVDGGWLAR